MCPSEPTTLHQSLIRRRGPRVTILLIAVIAMSIADLIMTLTHLGGFGMFEANPLARWIMHLGSPALVIAWKGLTVGLSAGILYWYRRYRSSEFAAWACFAVLVWLTVRWTNYHEMLERIAPDMAEMNASTDPRWVAIVPLD